MFGGRGDGSLFEKSSAKTFLKFYFRVDCLCPLLLRKLLGKLGRTVGAYWINESYGLSGDKAIDKRDPLVLALKSWIDEEYENGRQTMLSDGEVADKIKELTRNSDFPTILE